MIDQEMMLVVADQRMENPTFDYSQLDADVLDALIDQENILEGVLKRSRIEIGNILLRVKEILPHGTFGPWYRSKGITKNFGWRCVQEAKGNALQRPSIFNKIPMMATYTGRPCVYIRWIEHEQRYYVGATSSLYKRYGEKELREIVALKEYATAPEAFQREQELSDIGEYNGFPLSDKHMYEEDKSSSLELLPDQPEDEPPLITAQVKLAEYDPTNVVESTVEGTTSEPQPEQPKKNGHKPKNPQWRRDADGNWHTEPVSRYMYGKSIVLTRGTGAKKEQIKMEYGGVKEPHVIAWIDDDQLDDIMRCGATLKSE
jgi:hypothetical protein